MKFLRDVASFVLGAIGMTFFLIGGGLLMLAVIVSDDVSLKTDLNSIRADLNSMKVPISPLEK